MKAQSLYLMIKNKKNSVTVVILCGGLATRLKHISKQIPKSLILINNKCFIDYQFDYLNSYNINKVVLCIGHLGNFIEDHVKNIKHKYKFKIIFSKEKNKLGTGGALINAYNKLPKNFVIMYGDSLLNINLDKLLKKYRINKFKYLITVYQNKNRNYKNNILIKNKKIVKYSKKKSFNYIDYGVTIMNKSILEIFRKNNYNNDSNFDLGLITLYAIQNNILNYSISKIKFQEIGSMYGIKLAERYIKKKILTK